MKKTLILPPKIGKYLIFYSFLDQSIKYIDGEVFIGWPFKIENRIEGAFVKISSTENEITLSNDICGLYRLYYWTDGNKIFITDNIDCFIQSDQHKKLGIIPEEKELFQKSLGYTSGDTTFYNGIKKMPPASVLTISETGLYVQNAFPFRNIERTANKERHIDLTKQEVKRILLVLKESKNEIILFYSGGADSNYIAMVLNELSIPFRAVFLYDKSNRANADAELRKAKKNASKISIKSFEAIELNSNDSSFDDIISSYMRFDRHNARLHFLGLDMITKKYGNHITVLNGQNSDAIFSYGPSEKTVSSFIKRYLIYGGNRILKLFICFVFSLYCRRFMRIPCTEKEQYLTIATNHRYIKLYDLSYSHKTRQYLENKISDLAQTHSFNKNCLEMFLKIFYYIQGPDSQVVIQSARYFQIDELILPFASSKLIEFTLQYKDDQYELNHPKYCIRQPIEQSIL